MNTLQKKSSIFVLLLTSLVTATPASAGSSKIPVWTAIEDFKPAQYLGLWYEIASFPQSFSKGCECTTAFYREGGDDDIIVQNQCRKGDVGSEWDLANGKAYFPYEKNIGALRVSFFWPFYGDYWIVELGENYEYSVVSNSDASTLWILSRTPSLGAETLEAIKTRIRAQGVSLENLETMVQDNCDDRPHGNEKS